MKTEPLRGEKLLKTAINQILAHPESWDQTSWHSDCGTRHCLAGWCQILGGRKADGAKASADAAELLGISSCEASVLFRASCGLGEMYAFAQKMSLAGYDRDGYDRAGYDRAGYDRDGYDRDGYDRAGYDRAGYDRDGYNRAGEKLKPFDL